MDSRALCSASGNGVDGGVHRGHVVGVRERDENLLEAEAVDWLTEKFSFSKWNLEDSGWWWLWKMLRWVDLDNFCVVGQTHDSIRLLYMFERDTLGSFSWQFGLASRHHAALQQQYLPSKILSY